MSKNGAIQLLTLLVLAFPALAQLQRSETHGTQSPAVIAGGDVSIAYGLTVDQVQELTKAAAAGAVGPLADRIVDLSNRLGVTHNAAVTMLQIIGQEDVPVERLPRKLIEVAEQYKSAMDRVAGLDSRDPATRDLVEQAEAALKSGHLDEADQLLSRAEQDEVAAARKALGLAQQAQMAADQRLLRAAKDREVRGDIAMTRLRYRDAAQHFQEAADLVPAGYPDEKGRLLHAKGNALLEQGEERGDYPALVNAIAAYRGALDQRPRERVPLKWAATQSNLGVALARLGERDSGTQRLEEAVAVSRAALEEWTRERVPLDWAATQSNLGVVLHMLGERESGTAQLEEAVVVFRAALEERTRDRAPLDWARTQSSLGNALTKLGNRENGTARLEEAVAAYRAALEEHTRKRVPLDWAMVQNNLGTVLSELGEREAGTARLEEAIAAHRAALEEYARARAAPLGNSSEQPRLRAPEARREGKRDNTADGSGRCVPSGARRTDSRTGAARLGGDPEQPG
jgi:tetratricopeptide (TPR) repeat protein